MSIKARAVRAVSRKSRESKVSWVQDLIPAGRSVLLVGVTPVAKGGRTGSANLIERSFVGRNNIHSLVYDAGEPDFESEYSRGDGCDLRFEDNSFDYVFSNAVIEHVGGPERAQLMLSEARRVSRFGSIHTTPYRWFPIETHTQVPVLHWLPRGALQNAAFHAAGKPHWNERDYYLFGARSAQSLSDAYRVSFISPLSLGLLAFK